MFNINHPKFPYNICAKNVHDKDKAVQCDLCEFQIHINCDNLNYLDYRYIQNCDEFWYYIECCSIIFPFNFLSSNTDSNISQWKDLENNHNRSLLLKPSLKLEFSANQFNNATLENGNDSEKVASSKYYDIDEMCNIEIPSQNISINKIQSHKILIII